MTVGLAGTDFFLGLAVGRSVTVGLAGTNFFLGLAVGRSVTVGLAADDVCAFLASENRRHNYHFCTQNAELMQN